MTAAAKPFRLFLIGLILTVTATLLLYQFIPTYNLLGESHFDYPIVNENRRLLASELSNTNADILLKLGIYNIAYWLIIILTYSALEHFKRIKFQSSLLKFHFALSIAAFIFIICLNKLVTYTDFFNWAPSDIYISSNTSNYDKAQLSKNVLFFNSLTSPTALAGFVFLALGTGCFLINIVNGFKKKET